MSKANKDVVAACCVLVLALFSFCVSAAMKTPREFVEGPGIFTGLISIFMALLGVIYLIRSIRQGGGVAFLQLGRSAIGFCRSRDNMPTILGLLLPAVYVFIAIPLVGFYLSSALFMGVIFFRYVRRWARWISVLISIGTAVTLYLVFTVLFQLQIW
jgi:hypothetical protein